MKIITCAHFRQRAVERFGCSPEKCDKLANKAYRSTKTIPHNIEYAKELTHQNQTMRFYQGFIFCYWPHRNKKDCMVAKTLFRAVAHRYKPTAKNNRRWTAYKMALMFK